MLAILLIFFIGKYFYKLAEKYEKSKWGFGVLGIVTYYVGTMIFGLIYGIIYFSMNPEATEDSIDEFSIGLMALLFGLIVCYILYYLLKKNWKKLSEQNQKQGSIEDIGIEE